MLLLTRDNCDHVSEQVVVGPLFKVSLRRSRSDNETKKK
jgi:hypothetical protein